MKEVSLLTFSLLALMPLAHARNGGENGATPVARPENIHCGLYFSGDTRAQAEGDALVANSAAVVKGNAQGVDYVFSVRGKTAVGRLVVAETGQTVTAQGAIEMLRNGGGSRAALASLQDRLNARHGEDDANDGTAEKEAGFELSLVQNGAGPASNVKMKCISTNVRAVQ